MGNENSIPSEDSIFHPVNEHHSLDDIELKMGSAGERSYLERMGLQTEVASAFGELSASLAAIEKIHTRLAASNHARLLAPDCAGVFEILDVELTEAMHFALSQLLATARSRLEGGLEEMISNCPRHGTDTTQGIGKT